MSALLLVPFSPGFCIVLLGAINGGMCMSSFIITMLCLNLPRSQVERTALLCGFDCIKCLTACMCQPQDDEAQKHCSVWQWYSILESRRLQEVLFSYSIDTRVTGSHSHFVKAKAAQHSFSRDAGRASM